MNREEAFLAVAELLHESQGIPLGEITLEKSVHIDLGMDGDDAVEFFEEFAVRFGLGLAALYSDWGNYFGSEAVDFGAMFDALTSLLFFRRTLPRAMPLRVSTLVQSVVEGRWKAIGDHEG